MPSPVVTRRDYNPAEPRDPHSGKWIGVLTGASVVKKLGRMTTDDFFAAHGGDNAWHDQYGGNGAPDLILWNSGEASLYYHPDKGGKTTFVLSSLDSHSAGRFAKAMDWAADHPLVKPAHLADGPATDTRTVKLPDSEVHIGYGYESSDDSTGDSWLYVTATFPAGAAGGTDKTFTMYEDVDETGSSLAGDLRSLADDIDSKAYTAPGAGRGTAHRLRPALPNPVNVREFIEAEHPRNPANGKSEVVVMPFDAPVTEADAVRELGVRWNRTGAVRADWNPVDHPRNPANGKFVDKHGGVAGAVERVAGAVVTAGDVVGIAAESGLLKPANLRAARQVARVAKPPHKVVKVLGPNAGKAAGHALTGVGAVLDGYQLRKSWGKDWGQVTFSTVSLGLTAASLFVPPAAMVLGAAGLGVGLLSNSDKVRTKVGDFTAPAWSAVDRGFKDLAAEWHSGVSEIRATANQVKHRPRTASAAIKHATG